MSKSYTVYFTIGVTVTDNSQGKLSEQEIINSIQVDCDTSSTDSSVAIDDSYVEYCDIMNDDEDDE